jgi:hypothetical protein
MVQVTNAPEGRTYISYSWEPTEQAKECRDRFFVPLWPEDYVLVETPHIVPNGKWVMDYRPGWGPSWLVGAEWNDIEEVNLTGKSGQFYDTRTLYICDKPFGFIARHDDLDYSDTPKSELRKTLVCARQLHKGELGQTVPTPRLRYVRQAFEPDTKQNVWKARERKRSNYGWVRLTDLATAAGMRPVDLVFDFWQYSGHCNYSSYNNDQNGGQLLDIIIAWTDDDIRHKCPNVRSTTQSEMMELARLGFLNARFMNPIYVRRGFAYTVLRLLALGVRPEVTQLV